MLRVNAQTSWCRMGPQQGEKLHQLLHWSRLGAFIGSTCKQKSEFLILTSHDRSNFKKNSCGLFKGEHLYRIVGVSTRLNC